MLIPLRTLVSTVDRSVNFVRPTDTGYFESRFVSRPNANYFIAYLSSQSGCSRGCRMCHLTATKQTKFKDASLADFETQAELVLQHWDASEFKASHQTVHFNFMARGEALECSTILEHGPDLLSMLGQKAQSRGLQAKFLISTILPKSFLLNEFEALFHDRDFYVPEIYYSLYSVDPSFRQKWLPQAMSPQSALRKLTRWQAASGKRPKIHFAFIKGENDSEQSVRDLAHEVIVSGLQTDFNIVRYNPPNDTSQESSEEVIARNVEILKELLPDSDVRVIPRVGLDVFASCGTFVSDKE